MSRTPFRSVLAALAAAALLGAGGAQAQEGSRGGRIQPGGAPRGQAVPPVTANLNSSRPAVQPALPGQGVRSAGAAQTRPAAAIAGQTARRVDPPARFVTAVQSQNQARAAAGAPPLVWSAAREDEARAAATAIASANSCTRTATDRAGRERDVSVYWGASMRMLDGSNAVQDLSANYIVSEWLTQKSRWDATLGCSRPGECDAYQRIIRPAARTVGCAVAICSDRSQIWACKYGD
jgi:pathogenesis-related protein 1